MRLRSTGILTVAIASTALAQTYTIKTFAGGALPESLPALSASLGGINGVAVDSAGNVYLSLGDYDIVVRCDVNTSVLTRVAGTGIPGFSGDNGPAASAQLANPTGIAIDSAGNLYIADADNNRIRMVSNGVITTIAGTGAAGFAGDNGPAASAQFNGLGALALDTAGSLYVVDFYNQVVRKISNGIITTAAGNGTYGYSGDKGPATSAQLAGPSGIAVDYLGNLYIAEGYNNCVRKVSNGIITTLAGTGTPGYGGDFGAPASAMLREPVDLALDSQSNLYIADYGNNRIRMVTFSNPKISTVAGDGQVIYNGDHVAATGASLLSPQHVAADAFGNLFIVDGSRVRKVARGMISNFAGGGTPAGENGPALEAQLLRPQGLALDNAGNIYISDAGTGRVLKVAAAGATLTRVAGTGTSQGSAAENTRATDALLGAPSGVAVNAAGDLFLADSQTQRLRKVSNGIITTVAGGGATLGDNGPAAKAKLANPQAVAVDAAGSLYLADLNRIRMISNGTITTVAGNGSSGYQGDGGVATAAEISNPAGVAVDSSGNFYFADYGNHRVRTVANGNISTVHRSRAPSG
jgi:sugar lactone lactonase YvrE